MDTSTSIENHVTRNTADETPGTTYNLQQYKCIVVAVAEAVRHTCPLLTATKRHLSLTHTILARSQQILHTSTPEKILRFSYAHLICRMYIATSGHRMVQVVALTCPGVLRLPRRSSRTQTSVSVCFGGSGKVYGMSLATPCLDLALKPGIVEAISH